MTVRVVAVSDAEGAIVNADMLAAAEGVHRQLRPHLPADYAGRMKEVFAGGAEMAVALVGGTVAGVTVFRVMERTFSGRELYCDDLVTDAGQRSTGVGRALMQYMQDVCRSRAVDAFTLDSGTHREQAHKFYFREGMTVTSFHFTKPISGKPTGLKPPVKSM